MSARTSLGADCLVPIHWVYSYLALGEKSVLYLSVIFLPKLKHSLIWGGSIPLSLYPNSQPEEPLCLRSAVELLSGKQQQSRQKHCLIRHWGRWPQPIFFFFFCKTSQSLCSIPPLCEMVEALRGLFLGFASLKWRRPGVLLVCKPSAVWKCHTWLRLYIIWTRNLDQGFSLFTKAMDFENTKKDLLL